MDERGKWLPKSKKEYVLDENGERIRLSSGRYKTRKVDLVDWNSQENAEVWCKVWADLANEFLEQNNRPERIDHRSYERQGIDQIRSGMKSREPRIRQLQKLIEQTQNLRKAQSIHDEYKQIRWKGK